jgi:hypothetical protein
MSSIVWRKSSLSGPEEDTDCVEVARFLGAIAVRDSKNPLGGTLSVAEETFADLLGRIKDGKLNLYGP